MTKSCLQPSRFVSSDILCKIDCQGHPEWFLILKLDPHWGSMRQLLSVPLPTTGSWFRPLMATMRQSRPRISRWRVGWCAAIAWPRRSLESNWSLQLGCRRTLFWLVDVDVWLCCFLCCHFAHPQIDQHVPGVVEPTDLAIWKGIY